MRILAQRKVSTYTVIVSEDTKIVYCKGTSHLYWLLKVEIRSRPAGSLF